MSKKKKPRKKKKATNKWGSDTSIPKMSKTNAPRSRVRRVISADQMVTLAPGEVASFRVDSGKRWSMALGPTTYQ